MTHFELAPFDKNDWKLIKCNMRHMLLKPRLLLTLIGSLLCVAISIYYQSKGVHSTTIIFRIATLIIICAFLQGIYLHYQYQLLLNEIRIVNSNLYYTEITETNLAFIQVALLNDQEQHELYIWLLSTQESKDVHDVLEQIAGASLDTPLSFLPQEKRYAMRRALLYIEALKEETLFSKNSVRNSLLDYGDLRNVR